MSEINNTPIRLRTVQTVRIVHNDLEIGPGQVEQFRRGKATKEQAIELSWIFRTIEEIKDLNINKYTRIQWHQQGQCREYWYDERCGLDADDWVVIQPNMVTTVGRWVLVEVVDHYARQKIAELEQRLNSL